mmetsp:Transcript_37663/g.80198  ORF Transcript_37663/g.80198 Transcript_37663/m.80198 type:complete len:428 (-) Transcript_37663:460-1743(-)|eukprot:CAMPEP_0183359706 /NCGR_PEP_ID=MMETSP0164_2-20130417/53060_1 /TAXON_ID=221442 /ORGANISM="Coccolithus pelagicus ssp braarudi, Strain PLY182g" /LENGTH=427 /DNA_ID=CAMNT_0025533885 /DNA_START=30 /DNA_END=1313 /DNA_ORIENTATION=+
MAVWQWLDERVGWIEYSTNVATDLESAFALPHVTEVSIKLLAGKKYVVNLHDMAQCNMHTGFSRPVRRMASTVSERWEWHSGDVWEAMDSTHAAQLSAAMCAGRATTTIYIKRWVYRVDLQQMQQRNTHTGKVRSLRRYPVGTSSAARSSVAPAGRSVRVVQPQSKLRAAPHREVFDARGVVDLAHITSWTVLHPGEWPSNAQDPIVLSDLGEDGEVVVRLPCHTPAMPCLFNRSTLEQALPRTRKCPSCSQPYALPGPQPSGTLHIQHSDQSCVGHDGVGSLLLRFEFPNGTQGPNDPEPGRAYRGTDRLCVYPDDEVGWTAVALLFRGFRMGALFKVGTSVTTGAKRVVWVVHQKTRHDGGATQHGWPDTEYVTRLKSELMSLGMPAEHIEETPRSLQTLEAMLSQGQGICPSTAVATKPTQPHV